MRSEKTYLELPVIIGSFSKINGDLEFSSDVLIEGEACGKLSSEKRITIGGNGFFNGTLFARDLEVFGRLNGDIIVTGNVVFHSNCTIEGRIFTKFIDLKVGANLNGKVIMSDNPQNFYQIQVLSQETEPVDDSLMKKGKRYLPSVPNPVNFFAKVFKEMDTEMVTSQIYSSTSTELKP